VGFRELISSLFASSAPKPKQLTRGDDWYNATTGLGVSAYDQSIETTYNLGVDLTRRPTLIRRLLRSNSLCRKVVNKQVAGAWSTGVTYSATGVDGNDLTPDLLAELSRLEVESKIKKARALGRAFGGAVLLMSVDDGLAPSQPLNLARVRRLLYLRPIVRHDVASVELDTSGGARDGEPKYYTIALAGATQIKVHHSRVVRFEGLDVDRQTRQSLGGWTDSVLQPCYGAIRDYSSGIQSLSSQLQSATQTVYTIKGLHEQILAGNRQFVQDWIASVELCRSNLRAVILDADGEKLDFASRPLGDSVKVAQELQYSVAAACDMPIVELFGTPPSGLSSDDMSATRRFYDRIEVEEQQGEQGVALTTILEVITSQTLSATLNGAVVAYEWPSLYSPTALERAQINSTRAATLATLVDAGIVTPAEVRSAAGTIERLEIQDVDTSDADDDDASTGVILDPTERIQQARLAIQSGVLHLPDTAPTFRPLLGLDPLTPSDTESWFRLVKTSEGLSAADRIAGDVSYVPPREVQDNARRALEERAKLAPSKRGMTSVGIARARDLMNARPVSLDTIERMRSYFDRHAVDKLAESWSSKEWSKGRQAWFGWGGDAGRRWVAEILDNAGEGSTSS
jgi:phage-related protein (TIGR01555 family)